MLHLAAQKAALIVHDGVGNVNSARGELLGRVGLVPSVACRWELRDQLGANQCEMPLPKWYDSPIDRSATSEVD